MTSINITLVVVKMFYSGSRKILSCFEGSEYFWSITFLSPDLCKDHNFRLMRDSNLLYFCFCFCCWCIDAHMMLFMFIQTLLCHELALKCNVNHVRTWSLEYSMTLFSWVIFRCPRLPDQLWGEVWGCWGCWVHQCYWRDLWHYPGGEVWDSSGQTVLSYLQQKLSGEDNYNN